MSRLHSMMCLVAVWCALALLAGCAPGAPPALATISPEAAGLTWRECPHTADWAALAACLGHPLPLPTEAEKAGVSVDSEQGHRLQIGADVYETREALGLFRNSSAFYEEGRLPGWARLVAGVSPNRYTLYRNGQPIASLPGVRCAFDGHSPDRSLADIGGRAAWAFYDFDLEQATVVYDGQDVRALYGVDRAIAPYEVGGKLIFLASRGTESFVVYDGRRVDAGPLGVGTTLALCCEGALYNPRYGGGSYVFWASRDGASICVEVAAR